VLYKVSGMVTGKESESEMNENMKHRKLQRSSYSSEEVYEVPDKA